MGRYGSRRRTAGLSTPLRSGRDDNVAWKQCLAFPNKIVISTGGVMGLRLTQGNEKPRSGIHALWNRYPFLVIPTGAKRSGGTCGSADPSWRCFSTERSGVERPAVLLRLGPHFMERQCHQ